MSLKVHVFIYIFYDYSERINRKRCDEIFIEPCDALYNCTISIINVYFENVNKWVFIVQRVVFTLNNKILISRNTSS